MKKTLILKTENNDETLELLPNRLLLTSTYLANIQSSRAKRVLYFCQMGFLALLFMLATLVIGYFTLYHVTLECQRPDIGQPAICEVTKQHTLRRFISSGSEPILTQATIKSITLEHNGAGSGGCRLAITTTTGQSVLPLGDLFSSMQCGFRDKVNALQPLATLDHPRQETGTIKETFSDNLFSWVGTVLFLLFTFYMERELLFDGRLWKLRLDSQRRQLTAYYMRPFSDYERTVSFSEIKELVFIHDINDSKTPKHPYFLLTNGKKIVFELYCENSERHVIVDELRAVLYDR